MTENAFCWSFFATLSRLVEITKAYKNLACHTGAKQSGLHSRLEIWRIRKRRSFWSRPEFPGSVDDLNFPPAQCHRFTATRPSVPIEFFPAHFSYSDWLFSKLLMVVESSQFRNQFKTSTSLYCSSEETSKSSNKLLWSGLKEFSSDLNGIVVMRSNENWMNGMAFHDCLRLRFWEVVKYENFLFDRS